MYAEQKNKSLLDVLFLTADEMVHRYPHQKIVGVGHSPSWLIYAIGQIRKDRGLDKNIGFIPFSGHHLKYDSFAVQNENSALVRLEDGKYYNQDRMKPEEGSIRTYFDTLSRNAKSVLGLAKEACTSNEKIVLLDLAVRGETIISFVSELDRYLQKNKKTSFAEKFQLHVFKPYYCGPHDITFEIEGATYNAYVQSGAAGYMLNALSGSNGSYSNLGTPDHDKKMARFMPYRSLAMGVLSGVSHANKDAIVDMKLQIKERLPMLRSNSGRDALFQSMAQTERNIRTPKPEWRSIEITGPHG